jgi:hypothetical protein
LGLLAVGLWALDRWVETDREQAERKTHEFAAAAEAGDISKMEQLLSEQLDARAFGSRTQLLSLARQYLTRDGRRSIQFWALETRLARNGQLTVTCNFKAAGQFGSYEIPAQLGLIELVFRKENDSQWRIREFRAMNIQGEDLRVPN